MQMRAWGVAPSRLLPEGEQPPKSQMPSDRAAYEAAFPALPTAAATKPRPALLVSERLDAYDQSLGRRVVAYRNSPEGRVKIEAAREKHNALYLTLLGFQFAEVEQDAEDGSITEGEFLVYVT